MKAHINQCMLDWSAKDDGNFFGMDDVNVFDRDLPEPDKHPIFCSLQNARKLQKLDFYPGLFFEPEWSGMVQARSVIGSEHFLNKYPSFLPAGMIEERMDMFLENLPAGIFIRPVSSEKPFAGQPLDRNDEKAHWKAISQGSAIPYDCWCEISGRESILYETRFWISDGRIVTWSSYPGMPDESWAPVNTEQDVVDFASKIVSETVYPLDLWVFDVCKTECGRVAIVETNAWSTSGFYFADIEKIIAETKKWIF